MAAGLWMRVDADGRIMVRGSPETIPPGLLELLREQRVDLQRLLGGDLCRECGELIGWPRALGVVFDNGMAAHLSCYEQNRATDPPWPHIARSAPPHTNAPSSQ